MCKKRSNNSFLSGIFLGSTTAIVLIVVVYTIELINFYNSHQILHQTINIITNKADDSSSIIVKQINDSYNIGNISTNITTNYRANTVKITTHNNANKIIKNNDMNMKSNASGKNSQMADISPYKIKCKFKDSSMLPKLWDIDEILMTDEIGYMHVFKSGGTTIYKFLWNIVEDQLIGNNTYDFKHLTPPGWTPKKKRKSYL